MILIVVAASAATPDPRFAQLRARIATYCLNAPACVDKKRNAAKNFIGAGTMRRFQVPR